MTKKKAVILNGIRNGDNCYDATLNELTQLLDQDYSEIKLFKLDQFNIAHCTGCFGCWVKTPGVCKTADDGRDIIKSIIQSDITILYSPVTFGGYSSTLKVMVDRFIPLVLPFFGKFHGETHHSLRYSVYPRIVGIGVRNHGREKEDQIFKTLVGRNALNFHAPSYAAEVIDCNNDIEAIRDSIKDVVYRSDSLPSRQQVTSFFPEVSENHSFDNKQKVPGKVLLIVGSPKIKHRSTSDVLGHYLLDGMKEVGWQTESLMLKRSLVREKGRNELCLAVDRADLIVFAFPLYIDSLPFLVTKALEIIADHKNTSQVKKPQRVFTIINNGFPEPYQNSLALAICRSFSDQIGFYWAGALAMGAGEALCSGQSLDEKKRSGPPVKHVAKALDMASDKLSKGKTVGASIQTMISKSPIPIVPFGLWCWLFTKIGGNWWKQQALEHKVKEEELYAKPYAD